MRRGRVDSIGASPTLVRFAMVWGAAIVAVRVARVLPWAVWDWVRE